MSDDEVKREVSLGSVAVKCSRCGHPFVNGTTIDDEVHDHAERCFVVGDYVQSLGYFKVEGVIERVIARGCFSVRVAMDIPGSGYKAGTCMAFGSGYKAGTCMAFGASILRRIEHPGRAQCTSPHAFIRGPESGPDRLGPPDETCDLCQCDPRNSIHHRSECKHPYRGLACGCPIGEPIRRTSPTLYDGLTAEQCFDVYEASQRECFPWAHQLTPAQLAAARDLWSAQLRARIAASRERERLQVVVQQDAGDFEW